jgi:redox-sensitive bicupin YhaK (pirin superfamily)
MTPRIEVRRAEDRFRTRIDWLDSHHSFSFGHHRDPNNTHHGLLLVNNDDVVRAGSGFGMHPHRDMEIVTWVLRGELEHRDSEGNHGIIRPGLAQRMSAGTGIHHSEHNPSRDVDVHFLQMWVLPDTAGIRPGYEQLDISDEISSGTLVPIASGRPDHGAIRIHQRNAVLWGARVAPNARIDVPDDRHAHVFVAVGSGVLDPGGHLATGDAARLAGAEGLGFVAGDDGAEVLIWTTA